MPYGLRKAPRGHRYRVQRRVPKDLLQTYKRTYVERYLGTSDRAEARRQAERAWSELGKEFERVRHGQQTVADLEDRVRKLVTVWTWERLRGDPREEGPVAADIDSLQAWAYYGQLACEHYGAAYDGGNMEPADRGALFGLEAGLSLFRRGIEPAGAPAGSATPKSTPVAPQTAYTGALTVSEAFTAYKVSGARTAGDKTVKQAESSVRLLADHVGHKTRVEDVTTRDASSFRDTLRSISPAYRRDRNLANMSLQDMARSYPADGDDRLSRETVNRHLSNLRQMFKILQKDGYLPRDHDNPFEGVSIPKPKRGNGAQHKDGAKVRPLADAEIHTLLAGLPDLPAGPPRGFKQSARAAMLLAAHAGLRLGEIAALRPADVVSLPNGYTMLYVREGKTGNAPRRVALPRSLNQLGAWIKHCPHGPLGKSARHFSEEFAKHRRAAGIPDEDADGRVAQFRSIRKSYRGKLAAGHVDGDVINCLMGHERDFGAAHYTPEGPPDHERTRVAELVEYRDA